MTSVRKRLTKDLRLGDSILDVGCGSGRDTKAFIDEGCQVAVIDSCGKLCKKQVS